MIGRPLLAGWLMCVIWVVAATPALGQPPSTEDRPLTSSGDGVPERRAHELDPELLEIVDQIVGLRLSEEGLLSELSEDERARVLDAVARLLEPADVSGGLDGETDVGPDRAETSAPVASGEVAQRSSGFEPPTRIAGAAVVPAEPAEPTPPSVTPGDTPGADADEAAPSVRAEGDSVACPGWLVWDTNEDRMLSGADRYWRHFVLWVDDGDGVAEADEMRDTFELGLRKLDLDLRSYDGARDSTGVVERRQIDGLERLRVELLRGAAEYGVLAIDLDGMVRGEAPALRLRSADGESVRDLQTGFVPVQEGLEVEESFGNQTRWRRLLCVR